MRLLFTLLLFGLFAAVAPKITSYIIGTSTVKNGSGKDRTTYGDGEVFLAEKFDTTKIYTENHAIGGRSSRAFITSLKKCRLRKYLK